MSYDNTLGNTGLTGLFNLEPYLIVSKVIRNCPGFGFIRFVIGLEKYHHFLDQSDVKTKTTHYLVAHVFPRFRQLGCSFSSHWLL